MNLGTPDVTTVADGSAAPLWPCAWKTELHWRPYQCPELVVGKEQLCILHSLNPTKDAAQFRVRVKSKKENGDFDFRGTFFPEVFHVHGSLKKADFSECIFGDRAEFFAAQFEDTVDFCSTVFQNAAYFGGTVFKRAGLFRDTRFQGVAYFHRARFGLSGKEPEDASDFSSAIFETDANFTSAEFCCGVGFRKVKFLGDCSFRETLFRHGPAIPGQGDAPSAEFHCRFVGKVYFDANRVDGTLDFTGAEFSSALIVRGPFRDGRFFPAGDSPPPAEIVPELRFETVLLESPENVRFQNINLGCSTFRATNIRRTEFHNVTWPKKLLSKRLVRTPGIPSRPVNWRQLMQQRWRLLLLFLAHNTTADEWSSREHYEPAARQVCRDLKANLEDQRDYADAGDFYYAEMELKRRQVPPTRRILYLAYWLVCGYGEKPLRAFVVFILLWLLLAAGFTRSYFTLADRVSWRSTSYDSHQPFRPGFSEATGYSARSLALQQRGGYLSPYTPGAQRLTLLANLIGPVQFGLFLLAMRRRFRR